MPRPAFKPTKEQRRMVKSLAAIGMRHDHIAVVIGVRSPKTVRKHFRKELFVGSAEAVATVTRVAYEMAASGKCPRMTEYWLHTMSDVEEQADTAEDDMYSTRRHGTCELIFAPRQPSPLQPQEVALASNEI